MASVAFTASMAMNVVHSMLPTWDEREEAETSTVG
jgi:hypothetical protein